MSTQHTPMAQVSEDAVFFLSKQPDGSRWPVGTKLYAETPLIAAAPELLAAAQLAVACESGTVWARQLMAVIAKATGDAP